METSDQNQNENIIQFPLRPEMDPHQINLAATLIGRKSAVLQIPRPPASLGKVREVLLTDIFRGLSCGLPVILGYLPISFAFGVLAANNQIPFAAALGMSVFVYAGSSQFIVVGLLAQGAAITTIVFTTFLINLRMFLMSAALLPQVRHWSGLKRFLFSLIDG